MKPVQSKTMAVLYLKSHYNLVLINTHTRPGSWSHTPVSPNSRGASAPSSLKDVATIKRRKLAKKNMRKNGRKQVYELVEGTNREQIRPWP